MLVRSHGEGAIRLMRALTSRVDGPTAEQLAGVTSGPMDPDAPLPWDFVRGAYSREQLRRAYDVVVKRLDE